MVRNVHDIVTLLSIKNLTDIPLLYTIYTGLGLNSAHICDQQLFVTHNSPYCHVLGMSD